MAHHLETAETRAVVVVVLDVLEEENANVNYQVKNIISLAFTMVLLLVTSTAGAEGHYPEDGWWWNPGASGRGYFIERQQDVMFVAAFVYTENGAPQWLSAQGSFVPVDDVAGLIGSYSGTVYYSSGGQCIGCAYTTPLTEESAQGPLTINFADNQNGSLEWSGETVPITRFKWSWFDAVDQLSGTWLLTQVDGISPLSQIVNITDAGDSGFALITDRFNDAAVGSVELMGGDLVLSLTDASEEVLPLMMPESRRFYAGFNDANTLQVVALRLDDMPLAILDSGTTDEIMRFSIVDTGQVLCYDELGMAATCPIVGEPLHGQDAQYEGNKPDFTDNGDGTVSDNITGLLWQQSPDTDLDGHIDTSDKLTHVQSQTYCSNLTLAGNSDWWLPDIKQLYSLIDFSGIDIDASRTDTNGLTPFIDTAYFDFGYGDIGAGERIIDAQYASSTLYVSNTANDGGGTLFGVNFADGRIKGYGLSLSGQDKTFYVRCVRGRGNYGQNDFIANGDLTLTDKASGLMWAQDDSVVSLDWQQALDWVVQQNVSNYLRYNDWRLPNAKELQSIVDYTRSPDTTNSAAIDPLFNTTDITNEAGLADYAAYWTSTTHVNSTTFPGAASVYLNFGRSMGYMRNSWVDVHGAGAQRSDPKTGDPADYPTGRGPQGDAIRIYNQVRLVRDVR